MKRNYLSKLIAGLQITIGLATLIILYSTCNASTESKVYTAAAFKCGACGVEFKKCASCDVPPEEHHNVNHIPKHEGCKGIGKAINK